LHQSRSWGDKNHLALNRRCVIRAGNNDKR
jgi:hypothetical protein